MIRSRPICEHTQDPTNLIARRYSDAAREVVELACTVCGKTVREERPKPRGSTETT